MTGSRTSLYTLHAQPMVRDYLSTWDRVVGSVQGGGPNLVPAVCHHHPHLPQPTPSGKVRRAACQTLHVRRAPRNWGGHALGLGEGASQGDVPCMECKQNGIGSRHACMPWPGPRTPAKEPWRTLPLRRYACTPGAQVGKTADRPLAIPSLRPAGLDLPGPLP